MQHQAGFCTTKEEVEKMVKLNPNIKVCTTLLFHPLTLVKKIHRVAYPYHLLNSNTGIIPKKRLESGTEKEQKPILIGPFVSRRSICDSSVCRTWVLGVLSLLCYSGAPVHPEQWNKKSKSLYKSQQFYTSKNMRCVFKAALCSRSPLAGKEV